MLVTAIAILVSDRIMSEQLKLADELLDNFCKMWQNFMVNMLTVFNFLSKIFIVLFLQ